MSTSTQRLRALLVSGRVANLPGVWTNVILGTLLAHPWVGIAFSNFRFNSSDFVLSCLLASCFYVGGSFLADAGNARFDAAHRPARPIPSGVLSSTRITFAGYALLAAGWFGGCVFDALRWAVEAPREIVTEVQSLTPHSARFLFFGFHYERAVLSTLLALAILLFAKLHKRLGVGAPFFMAFLRALLVVWAGSLAGHRVLDLPESNLIPYLLALLIYTTVFGLLARRESRPNSRVPAPLLPFLFLAPPVVISFHLVNLLWWARPFPGMETAITVFLFWGTASLTAIQRSLPTFVSRALAGFCLLDAFFATLISWQLGILCFALFLLTLLLQRLAPAN